MTDSQFAHGLATTLLVIVLVATWLVIPVIAIINLEPWLTRKQIVAWYVVPFTGILIFLWTR